MGVNDGQLVTEWTPTQKQQQLLEHVAANGTGKSRKDLCEKAGVSRQAFYEWLQDPNFVEAYRGLFHQRIAAAMPTAADVLTREMQKGNEWAMKEFLAQARLAKALDTPGSAQGPTFNFNLGDRRPQNWEEYQKVNEAMDQVIAERDKDES